MYIAKLTALGIPATRDEIINTVVTTVLWIKQNHPEAVVFPIAEEPLTRALLEAGIRISDNPDEIDLVIASYDRGFTYRKLQIAFDALWQHGKAQLITTNPDRYCPFPGGRGEPDAAAVQAHRQHIGVAVELRIEKRLEAALGRRHLRAHRDQGMGQAPHGIGIRRLVARKARQTFADDILDEAGDQALVADVAGAVGPA